MIKANFTIRKKLQTIGSLNEKEYSIYEGTGRCLFTVIQAQKQKGVCVMKLGIIRCMQTEDYCPGTTDFKMIREHKGVFEGIDEEIELIGFCNCGGCPAKKAVSRARKLVERGADKIAFASCIQKGTPIGYPCPFAKKRKDIIEKDLGDNVKLLDYTH